MASVGSGVAHAGTLLRDRFVRTAVVDPASPLHGAGAENIGVVNGRMSRTDQPSIGETYQELLNRRGWTHLESEHTWTPDELIDDYSIWSYGAVFAEVAVDELLGTVRIRRMDAYYDAGRIINPKLAHSQALGGMVWGIGMALLESSHIDPRDGRVVNANISDYLVPVNADVPALDATFLSAQDAIASPIGVKGLPMPCSTRPAGGSPSYPSPPNACSDCVGARCCQKNLPTSKIGCRGGGEVS